MLQDVTFHVRSGERIGIGKLDQDQTNSVACLMVLQVGRTGSGKSSLTLSLLRCIYTDGVVYYDGIPTNNMRLDALRSKITIIPQVVRRTFLDLTQTNFQHTTSISRSF